MMIRPTSVRARSIAVSPNGTAPAARSASQTACASSGAMITSYPCSPLNPVRGTVAGTPATVTSSGQNRKYLSSPRSRSTSGCSVTCEVGPWTAIIREIIRAVLDARIQVARGITEPVLESRGVDHDPEAILGEPVHVAVVDHGAVSVHERAVPDLAGLRPLHRVGEPSLDQPRRVRPRHLVLACREEVPDPGAGANRLILFQRVPTLVHRPGVPVLPYRLGPVGLVPRVQRRALVLGHQGCLLQSWTPQTSAARLLLGG